VESAEREFVDGLLIGATSMTRIRARLVGWDQNEMLGWACRFGDFSPHVKTLGEEFILSITDPFTYNS
jgi:hypothetical protein